jgi:hypothetical protein
LVLERFGMATESSREQHVVARVDMLVDWTVVGESFCGRSTFVHAVDPFERKGREVRFCRFCSKWGRVEVFASGGRR